MDAANLYLDFAKRKFVVKTYGYKIYVLKGLLDKLGNVPVDEIGPDGHSGLPLHTRDKP